MVSGKIGIDDFLAGVDGGPEKALGLLGKAKAARVRPDKQSSTLEHLCQNVEFLHTNDLKMYAAFSVNGHREICPIRSQFVREHATGMREVVAGETFTLPRQAGDHARLQGR